MKQILLTTTLVFISFLDLNAQSYEYKVITSVESIVPMGVGRSRIISYEEDKNYDDFTSERTDENNKQNKSKRSDIKIDDFEETKLLNFFSIAGINFKNIASQQLYKNATALLNSNNKLDFRTAYQSLSDIEDINPNYKDVRDLMNFAHNKGTDFVLVNMVNDTQKVIPTRLENDLLNFSSYGLNNFWAVYHSTPEDKITYDYNMLVNLRDINISPEQIKERQVIKEKQIADGKKNLLDDRGQVVKDSLGNTIQVDNLKTVRCEYYEFTQFKSTQVTGKVEYVNLNTNQLVDAFPVTSQFIFEHIYATSTGDRRALDTDLIPFLERRAVPFPSEEQMIYDTSEDLKLQLKNIINSYSFN